MDGPHCCDCLKPNKAEKHIDLRGRSQTTFTRGGG